MPGLLSLFENYRAAQEQRARDEEMRRLLAQQSQMAEALRASGTVPPTFGSLLQSVQPPPPASPPPEGFMGTVGQVLGDVLGGGRQRENPLALPQMQAQQHILDTVMRAAAAQEAERGREKRQGERETVLETRRAVAQRASETRQQAQFTHSEQMAKEERAAAEARQVQRDREAEDRRVKQVQERSDLETQREKGRATAATKAAARKEMDRMIDEYGPGMNQAQMNRFNRLATENPDAAREAGYTGFRWQPGSIWGGSVVPLEEQAPAGTSLGGPPRGAAAMAAHAAATQTLTPDQEARARELKKRLGIP